MFLADFQLMGSKLGGTYLWPIVAISNICQVLCFGAWFIYKRRKMVKEEGLALTSSVSKIFRCYRACNVWCKLTVKSTFRYLYIKRFRCHYWR